MSISFHTLSPEVRKRVRFDEEDSIYGSALSLIHLTLAISPGLLSGLRHLYLWVRATVAYVLPV